MKRIDSFILRGFQNASDWFQLTFGINNFSIVRIFIVLFAAGGCITNYIEYISDPEKGLDIWNILLSLMYSFVFFIASIGYEKICQNYPTSLNPLKKTLRDVRWLTIGMTMLSLIAVITTLFRPTVSTEQNQTKIISDFLVAYKFYAWAFFISWWVIIYFLSCTPKPPSKSKFKKLLEGLKNLSKKRELAKA